MRSTTLAAAAVLALAHSVHAEGTLYIVNHCANAVHLQSTSNKVDTDEMIPPGGTYSEKYRLNPSISPAGISCKLGFGEDDFDNITQMEYTWTPNINTVWYDLSNVNGQPFKDYGMVLVPSTTCCPRPSCPAGENDCPMAYLNPNDNWASHSCGQDTDLTLNLCVTEQPLYSNLQWPLNEINLATCGPIGGSGVISPPASPPPSPSPQPAPSPAPAPAPSSAVSSAASSNPGFGGVHLQESVPVSSPTATSAPPSSVTPPPQPALLPGQSIVTTSIYTQGQVAYELVIIQQEETVTAEPAVVTVAARSGPIGRRHEHEHQHKRHAHQHHKRGN